MKQSIKFILVAFLLQFNIGIINAAVDNLIIETNDARLTKSGFTAGTYGNTYSALYSSTAGSWVKWKPTSGDLTVGGSYELFICSVTRQLVHQPWDLSAPVEIFVNGVTYTKYLNQKWGVVKNTATEAAAVTSGPANPTDNVADYIMLSLGTYIVSGDGTEYIKLTANGGSKYTMAYNTKFTTVPINLLSSIAVTNGTLETAFDTNTFFNSILPTGNTVTLAITANNPSTTITVGSQTGTGTLNVTIDNSISMWESGIPIKTDYTGFPSQNYFLRIKSTPNYIINNENSFEYSETGTWGQSGLSGYYLTSRYSGTAGSTATWKPKKLAKGVYKLSFYNILRPSSSGETAAQISISSNLGNNLDVKTINQNLQSGFLDLGEYYFEGTDAEFVRATRTGSSPQYLQVDAVKYEKETISEVQEVAFRIFLSSSTNLSQNLTLPTTGDYGTTISWSSDMPLVISNTGVVTKPTDADKTVTLTATVSKNSDSYQRTFVFKVLKYFAIQEIALNQVVTDNTTSALVNNQLQITVSKSSALSPGFRVYAPIEKWDLNNYERVGIEIENTGTNAVTLSCWAVTNGWGGIGAYGIDGSSSGSATTTINPQEIGTQYIYIHSKYKDGLHKMIDPETINYFDIRFNSSTAIQSKILVKRIFAEMDVTSGAYDKTGRLIVPQMVEQNPAAGKYVKQQLGEYSGTQVFHSLYLPINWQAGTKYPVIVEYAPNIFYNAACYSTGKVEDVVNGYGISKGTGYIWISLPYLSIDGTYNETNGWGDKDKTVEYALKAIRSVCENYGGDPAGIFITGFSRGGIAAGYIGLRNDEIAETWLGFNACQHTDGDGWNGSEIDANIRIARLKGRSVFLLDNASYPWATMVPVAGAPLQSELSGIGAHSAANYLDNRPSTENLRTWMADTYLNKPGTFKITGTVKNDNDVPLANVLVETGATHFTYTDTNGNFELAGLIRGQKVVTFKNNGVLVGQTTIDLTENKVFNLTVSTTTRLQKKNEKVNSWLYPSIVKTDLQFQFDEDILQIEVFNASGLRQFISNKNIQTVNISNLKRGIYFVKINTTNRNLVERFIKE